MMLHITVTARIMGKTWGTILVDELISSESDVSMPTSPVYDRYKSGEGYHLVPPPYTGTFMPPKPDFIFHDATIINEHVPTVSDLEDESEGERMPTQKAPSFVQTPKHVKTPRLSVRPGNLHHALKDKGVIDSGCLRHITGNISYLFDYEEINGRYVAFGGNPKGGKIIRKDKIRTGKLDFDDVYFVKEPKFNLFSVSQMCEKNNSVIFTDTECIVLSSDFKLPDENHVLLRVPKKNNMYNVDLKNIVPLGDLTCLFAKATLDEGLPLKVFENDHTCVACKKGKQHRASCKSKPASSVSQPLHRLHMDLFGPNFVKSINKKSYCLVVTDDYSRFSWVFFLPTKDETSTILKTFITGIENEINLKVKIIKCDNGTEFKNQDLNQFYGMKGIKREFSVARTPQQNGITERKNMTLIEAARNMLADSLLSIPFWAEVVNTACYVQNKVLVTKPHNKTPYELLLGRTPSIRFMIPFGCRVTILNTLDPLVKEPEYEVHVSLSSSDTTKNMMTRLIERLKKRVFAAGPFNNAVSSNFKLGGKSLYVDPSQYPDDPDMPALEDITYSDDEEDEERIDYEEVFAPVARIEAIRLFLACASFMGFMVYQMDVRSAFLYEAIEEEVCVYHPLRFEDLDYPDKVYKVFKALYCLHQAPRAWYETLANYLLENDFQRGKIDQTLFIKKQKGDILLVHVYVNAIIFGSTNKDLLIDRKSASTPIDIKKPLLKDPDGKDVDVHTYKSMIGSLMYILLQAAMVKLIIDAVSAKLMLFSLMIADVHLMLLGYKQVHDDVADADAKTTPLSPAPATTSPPQQDVIHLFSQVESTQPPSPHQSPIAPPSSPPPQQPPFYNADISMALLNQLLETCTILTKKVRDLKQDKIAQAIEITKLKQRVIRLEKKRKLKASRRMHPNRGGIVELDTDEDVTLEEVDAEKDAKEHDEAEPAEVEEVLKVVTDAKLMTEVVATATTPITAAPIPKASTPRRKRGVIIQDPKEATTASLSVKSEVKTKDKGKGILVEEPKPLKRQAQIEHDEAFIRELEVELDANINWNELIDQHFNSIWAFLKKGEKEIEEKDGKRKEPKNFSDDFFLNTLKTMFEKPNVKASICKDQRGRYGLAKVKSCKLLESCGVHIITFITTQMILLVKRRYLLKRFTLDQMLNNVRLEVEEESEVSLELLIFVRRQHQKDFKEYMLRDYYCWLKTYCCWYKLKLLDNAAGLS
uniref:Putative ribonuclease H-like domain-containing protein n=1 Tax=Tanacetum cinerariifolium TaxID=118510 RepID=A0A6L2LJP0_TANCI|nr:putative ribonuclease H-like domain-containing protein [Tanacetum cinerariifolium]